ncbi:serine/threonine-protein kinase [Microcoleus sp. herbarium5]|uniref:serine/threonine-protein kinase n=1 Tax=Microcoleus sp. herbarium5 TaxID=3055434 RepID=UPI002FCF8A9F
MSLCINPTCPKPDHSQNTNNRHCQSCGSDLLLQGRDRVMRLLSDKSGFGKIYTAEERGISKILKVLKEHHNNNAKVVELFQQEAKVLAQFQHLGIPKVDGYFQYQTRNGLILHCFVMEKIEGPNLEEWLQQQGNHPISERQAIAWLKQLAEILHLVHGKQYFHRDIKPPNIMLRPNGQLVLIDFGTAREATYTYLAKVGVGHQITGIVSAGYTPPEQQNFQAVPQSDFFALGRTFVYLLTGQHPLNFYDVHKDVFRWRQAANISPSLADFIDNLMARRPGDRPHNTQVLLQRIEELAQKLAKRKTNLPLGAAAGVLLVLGGGIGFWFSKLGGSSVSPRDVSSPSPVVKSSPSSSPRDVSSPSPVVTSSPSSSPRDVSSPTPVVTSSPSSSPSRSSLENVSLVKTLTGHSKWVQSVAISPDGQTLVSGSEDRTIKIWNLATGNLIRTLSGHSIWVRSVAISPDGQTLVSGGGDKTITIWNLATGNLIGTLSGHSDSVSSVAISPDGQTLVSGSEDKTIKIWNLAAGNLIRTLSGHSNSVLSVAISPDGQTLVSGSEDNTIKIWNLATGNLIRTSGHSDSVLSVAISPDGQTLVSGSWDKTIKIWNLATGNLIRTSGHSDPVWSVAISPDGQTLVSSGSVDKTIKIWNLATGNLIRTLSGHSNDVISVAISPDGQTLVSGSFDDTIKIWRVSR